jgi:hypothetical protein
MPSLQELIRQAAQKYGLPPQYLAGLIQYESKGDPNAVSPTGARGLGQFTKGTGAQYGLNRRNVFDPAANIDATARFAKDNFNALSKALGRAPKPDEMYLAHLQGAAGASAGFRNPQARAVDVWNPRDVRVNLPASRRGELNTISAADYQALHKSNFNRAAGLKGGNIDIGDEPSLTALSAPSKPTRTTNREDSAETSILKQMTQTSPTEPEQVSEMARPSVKDAIRQSMDELGIKDNLQYAGFVPPGLTKGSARTRAKAAEGVEPRGGIPTERPPTTGTPYDRNQPGTRGMEGQYGDYVTKEKNRMWLEQYKSWRDGAGPHPGPSPKGLSEDDINSFVGRKGDGAVPLPPDPTKQPGTAVVPSAAVQAAPSGAVVPVRPEVIRGTVDPNSGGPVPRTSNTSPGGRAATAAAATALGVASTNTDPALQAVQERINQGHAAAAGKPPAQAAANVDPGTLKMLADQERRAGLPPGTLSSPNAGMETATLGPLIGQAMPMFKEVMQDPEGRQAVQTLVKKAAQQSARQADMTKDPTYYQRMAAQTQMQPGGGGGGDPIADRAMERAVMMDNQRAQPSAPTLAPRPPQTVPQQTTKGTVSVRRAPPEPVNETEQQILNQAIPPGAEKGDVPPQTGRTPVPPGYPQDQPVVRSQSVPPAMRGAADPRGAEGYPIGPGSYDPTGGVQGQPSSGQMPMDPVMMQLMQFFTQGGNSGNVG